ncbi:MAG: hypothetical protein ER33_11815 [Cyanobium sp. CACIAM 14]|nr:MAG: hypothetical protein ER33_11815 [Cyanobium sp. CACIAM 14]
MARLEALLAPAADGEPLRDAIGGLAAELGGAILWLDGRNASIALVAGSRAVAVQVLLELRSRSELGVLVSSREGMGGGAPASISVLEHVLSFLQTAVPGVVVRYRSDRDGPIRQAAAA